MANYFLLTLDTLGPASPSISIESGSNFATTQLVNLTIGCGDGDTTGYQMLIWGDVDTAHDVNIKATKETSTWMTYTTTKQIKLSSGDGSKRIWLQVRDDVRNNSAEVYDEIILDQSLPTVTVNGPDVSKISKLTEKNVSTFSFSVDSIFVEYKIKIVSAANAVENTGAAIGVANGSINMSGTGTFPADTPINCQIFGADLEAASPGDGSKIVKIFVKDQSGQWNV